MKEIVIGENLYYSSRRAGQILGYTNDYVGKLCREGKLEAVMLARSWYVKAECIENFAQSVELEKRQREARQSELRIAEYRSKRALFPASAGVMATLQNKDPLHRVLAMFLFLFAPAFALFAYTIDPSFGSRMFHLPSSPKNVLAAIITADENDEKNSFKENASYLLSVASNSFEFAFSSFGELPLRSYQLTSGMMKGSVAVAKDFGNFFVASIDNFNDVSKTIADSAVKIYSPLAQKTLGVVSTAAAVSWNAAGIPLELADSAGNFVSEKISFDRTSDDVSDLGEEPKKKSAQVAGAASANMSLWDKMIDKLSNAFVPLFLDDEVEVVEVPKPAPIATSVPAVQPEAPEPKLQISYISTSPVAQTIVERAVLGGITKADLDLAMNSLRYELISLNTETAKRITDLRARQEVRQTESLSRSIREVSQNSGLSGSPSLDGLIVDGSTLVVDETNNRVGIGTTSPYATLSVTGDFALTGGIYDNSASKGSNGAVLQSTGTGVTWVATSSLGITSGVSSVSNSDGTLTISPTTGNVVASLNLGHANTWTGVQQFNSAGGDAVGVNMGLNWQSTVIPILDIGTSNSDGYLQLQWDPFAATGGALVFQGNTTGYENIKAGILYGDEMSLLGSAVTNNNSDWINPGGDMWMIRSGSNGASGLLGFFWDSTDAELRLRDDNGTLRNLQVAGMDAQSYTGTWAGDTIAISSGGTGATSFGANRVPYINSGNTAFVSDSNLVYNGVNFGIGTSSPYAKLSVAGEIVASHLTATSTATSTFAGRINIGTTSPAFFSSDSAMRNSLVYSGSGPNGHGFADNVLYNRSGLAYNSFDAAAQIGSGSGTFDHLANFQSRGRFNGTTLANYYGFVDIPVVTAGTITQLDHFATLPTTGAGTIGTEQGLALGAMTGTFKVSIRSEDSAARMIHNGPGAFGANSYSLVTGAQLKSISTTEPQFRAQYDASNYMNMQASSVGLTTFTAVGSAPKFDFEGGNVGIGTTSPYAKLSVAGETVAENFTATSTTATSTFAGGFSAASKFYVLANGNVGIGDSTPDGFLDVESSGAVTTANYGLHLSNISTNTTTDGINKYGLYLTSTGSWTGSAGTATNNYGLYVDTVSGADNNYGAYFADNVGIGTATPAVKLQVTSASAEIARFTRSSSNNAAIGFTNSSGSIFAGLTSAGTTFSVGSTADVTADGTLYVNLSTDKVGVMTSAPDGVLEVNLGTSGASRLSYNDANGSAATYFDTTLSSAGLATFDVVGTGSAFSFSDNVGIGTTTPGARLHTLSTTEQLRIGYDTSTFSSFTTNSSGVLIATTTGNQFLFGQVGSASGAFLTFNPPSGEDDLFIFRNKAGGNALELGTDGSSHARLRVKNSAGTTLVELNANPAGVSYFNAGNVGIGETSPGSKLSVSGGATVGATYDTTAAPTNGLLVEGNVGVGTTSPWRKLSVTGTVGLDGLTNDGSGNYVCISANKEITYSTSACVGLSSKRYKHDITELGEIGLEQVMHMRPVSFIYDEDVSPNDQSLHLGFIAEEIDLINKDLVAYNEDGSVQSVKYNEFVPVIVKAIQELTKKVEDLISSLADKVVEIKEVVAGRLRIKDEVCVDEVCVTKDQFKALLIEARDGNPGVQHNDSNEEEENIETEEEPSGSTGESTETEEGTPDTEVVEEETEQTDVTEDTNVEEPESEETEEEVVEPEPEAESDDSDQDSSGDAGGEAAPAE